MPFWLGICGFENRDAVRDRIINVGGGTLTYLTASLPPNSESTTALQQSAMSIRVPWQNDATGGAFDGPVSGEFWYHIRYRPSAVTTANLRLGVARSGTEHITLSHTATTALVTLRVAGVVRATAAVNPLVLLTWERLHMHVGGNLTGNVITVYKDGNFGSPLITYPLILADETALGVVGLPNEFLAILPTGGGNGLDDMLAWDPNDANAISFQQLGQAGVKAVVVTGNGAEQDWTGGFGNIDERPAVDADKVTASAVGDISTYTKAAIVSANVYGVKVYARVTRTGTDAGVNFRFKAIDGASTYDGPSFPAPADGDLCHIMELAPDGSLWSPVNFDATRVGFESLT